MQLKSRLLTVLIDGAEPQKAEAFARDIGYIMDFDKNAVEACLKVLPSTRLARTSSEVKQAVDHASKAAPDVPRHVIELALRAMSFFVDGYLSDDIPEGDDAAWADDLINELKWLKESQRGRFSDLLKNLQELLPLMEDEERQERTRDGVLPVFKSLGITVEARAVRKDRYRWGMPIDKYHPEVLGIVHVASIHIGLDIGDPQDVYFQTDESSIDNIISSLVAAKKEMAALQSFIESKEQGEKT